MDTKVEREEGSKGKEREKRLSTISRLAVGGQKLKNKRATRDWRAGGELFRREGVLIVVGVLTWV